MLVALDNAQLSYLEDARVTRPDEASDFVARWRAAGAILAVSATVLAEIAQRPEWTEVERRLDAVEALGPVWYAGPPRMSVAKSADFVFVLEAVFEYRTRRADGTLSRGYDALRRHFWRPVDVADLHATAERDRTIALAFLKERERGIGSITGGRAARRAHRALGARQWPLPGAADYQNSGRVPPPVPFPFDPPREVSERELLAWGDYVETIATSRRDFELRLWAVQDVPCLKGKPLEDAGPVSALLYGVVLPHVRARRAHPTPFDLTVQRFKQGRQPTDAEVRALDFYRMPGVAAYLAVLRAQAHSSRPEDTGNLMDADRMALAPYVDLFFADRLTFRGFEQERRDRGQFLSPDSPPLHICRSGELTVTIEAVERRRKEMPHA